ncbi:MAG TPA: histidine phosphatase family protein [Microbacteriaceae bacterium]|nr:histidine phosphatase family protein [Microbacteriaceae bacterium]
MPRQLHLVRHGEVHNPERILYGRLPGFSLSERGQAMAEATADYLANRGVPIAAIVSSPLERTRQSAAPIAARAGLSVALDERLIEGANAFEGGRMRGRGGQLRRPANWWLLRNPLQPSWGEPYRDIVLRMRAAMDAAECTAGDADGDVVLVSHQLPIWMAHRASRREPLPHDPRGRRCALSSVTSFERHGGRWVEVAYADPAAGLSDGAIDVGAV